MAKKRFLTDVDEVLADFQTPALGIIERLFGQRLTPYDFEVWDVFSLFDKEQKEAIFAEIAKPSFCRSLEPKPGAVEAIRELRGIADVFAVTSHFPSSTWVHERDEWLHDLFGFERHHVIHTSAKFMVIGDALLDDNPSHIQAWMSEHPLGMGMLWHIPNTRNLGLDDVRVHTWEKVIDNAKQLDARKTVWDLLDDAEWDRESQPPGNFCRECGAFCRGSQIPTHKAGCLLDKVISWNRAR